MKTRHAAALVALATCSGGLAGCVKPSGGSSGAGSSGTGTSRTQITVRGSDTMVQLAQSWAQEFMKTHPTISVSVTGGGSNTGFAALVNKGTDIANASRPIKPVESDSIKKAGVEAQEFVVAQDALAIVVHPSNSVSELTMEQLKGIYTGKTSNWEDVGGPDRKIVLNSRETSSGTYVFFQEHVLGKGVPFAATAMLQPATSQIVQTVAQDQGGIGYVGLGYLAPSVKAVRVKLSAEQPGVAPSAATVLDGSYPLARPLFEYTVGEPAGPVKIWLDWVRGKDGQAIVGKLGFVPVAP